MNIEVFFTPAGIDDTEVEGRVALVIDVIRATSTIVEALANGARDVYPMESVEDALKLASSLGRGETLLCGERKGLKIEGFDLGNSPAEYTAEVVADKPLVMSTTNGTRAFLAVEDAERVIALSFLNLSAVADAVSGADSLVIACAGKEDRFSLDDAVCAGHVVKAILDRSEGGVELDDSAAAAMELAGRFEPTPSFLRTTAAGRALLDVGLGEDLSWCSRVDRHALVPEMRDRRIRVMEGRP